LPISCVPAVVVGAALAHLATAAGGCGVLACGGVGIDVELEFGVEFACGVVRVIPRPRRRWPRRCLGGVPPCGSRGPRWGDRGTVEVHAVPQGRRKSGTE
jgi:hypothetical protein